MSFEITQSNASDLKVLISEKFGFPSITRDTHGSVLLIPKPLKKKKGFLLNGIIFENNELGRGLLARMLMSSVEHLSVHAIVSDFSLYNNWLQGKDLNVAGFVIDLLEDVCVNSYVKLGLRGLLQDFALSNAVSYSTITNPEKINSTQALVQSALLSYLIAGRYRYLLPQNIRSDVLSILKKLHAFEKLLLQKCKSSGRKSWYSDDVNAMKIELAESIYKNLAKHGVTKQTIYLPYTDSHQEAQRVNQELMLDIGIIKEIMVNTYKTLGLELAGERSIQTMLHNILQGDTSNVLYDMAIERAWKERLVKQYAKLVKSTEFDDFVFPEEDYAEYSRMYSRYAVSIRKIIDQVRMTNNQLDSSPYQQVGQIDIQEVIQTIASKKTSNYNMFIRDDYQTKSEAWAILLDMSSSLRHFSATTQEMALCLGEIAKGVMAGEGNWGMYAFSNRFVVIKDIQEEYNTNVKARIGGHKTNGGLSYIPDALQLGAQIVASAGREHNFLFVISDGLPSGYPGIEASLDNTMKKLMQEGITVVSVRVESNELPKYLRSTALKVDSVNDLMAKFTRTYLELSTN